MELSRFVRPSSPLAPENRGGIRVAVIGCGYWGSKHVRVLSALPEVSRIFIVDPDRATTRSVADAYPGVAVATDLEEALRFADAVIVATPPSANMHTALAALRAGKHVLVEKPMATNAADAALLVEESRLRGLALMVGHIFEFNGAIRELRRRMDGGELGEILHIHSARLSLGVHRPDVNVIWDLAPHDISIANYLLDATPTSVRAWGSSLITRDTLDLAHFDLEYAGRGVTVSGHVSWVDPRKIRQVTVIGSSKMAVYDDLAEERLRIFDRGVIGAGSVSRRNTPMAYRYGDTVSPNITGDEPLRAEDSHFVRCAIDGTPPLSDGESGLSVVRVLEAIDRATRLVSRANIAATPLPLPSLNSAALA